MTDLTDENCLCCGAPYLVGDVKLVCSRGCDFNWCRKCYHCEQHCSCPAGPDLIFVPLEQSP